MKKYTFDKACDLMVNHGKKMVSDDFELIKYLYFNKDENRFKWTTYNGKEYIAINDNYFKSIWTEYVEEEKKYKTYNFSEAIDLMFNYDKKMVASYFKSTKYVHFDKNEQIFKRISNYGKESSFYMDESDYRATWTEYVGDK